MNNNKKKNATLNNRYDVRLKQKKKKKLKYFGITNKISTDAILKKERFTF